jgi:hypothetical protein
MSTRVTAINGEFAEWHPAGNPWLIAVAVMTATFMEVLDTSVANVALQHIAGSLSVSSDEATWVLTSYLVSKCRGPSRYGVAQSLLRPSAISDWLHCFIHLCVGPMRNG